MSHYQKEGQKHTTKMANRSSEDVAKFTLTKKKTACTKRLRAD
jgi:hypothetical protein